MREKGSQQFMNYGSTLSQTIHGFKSISREYIQIAYFAIFNVA